MTNGHDTPPTNGSGTRVRLDYLEKEVLRLRDQLHEISGQLAVIQTFMELSVADRRDLHKEISELDKESAARTQLFRWGIGLLVVTTPMAAVGLDRLLG